MKGAQENSHSKTPSTSTKRSGSSLGSIDVYAAQCQNCMKWRVIDTQEEFEEIRSKLSDEPFHCSKRGKSCDDPADLEYDSTRTWVMDKPNLPKAPEGFRRTLVLRKDYSKVDTYYITPTGKKLRSRNEIPAYLKDHPEHKGVSDTNFDFSSPKVMQDTVPEYFEQKDSATKRPKAPEGTQGSDAATGTGGVDSAANEPAAVDEANGSGAAATARSRMVKGRGRGRAAGGMARGRAAPMTATASRPSKTPAPTSQPPHAPAPSSQLAHTPAPPSQPPHTPVPPSQPTNTHAPPSQPTTLPTPASLPTTLPTPASLPTAPASQPLPKTKIFGVRRSGRLKIGVRKPTNQPPEHVDLILD